MDNASLLSKGQPQSQIYRQQYVQLIQELFQKGNAKEDKQYELGSMQPSYLSVVERQLTQWQADLNAHAYTLIELQAEEKQLLDEKELYTIRAPIKGTLQQFSGKYTGTYVQAGEVIASISPDSNLS